MRMPSLLPHDLCPEWVFNGSASLRNAAGQMIENVNKSVRRKQTVDAKYMDALWDEMVSLYRLDQINASNGMPLASAILLAALAICWLGMGVYSAAQKFKEKKYYNSGR